MKYKDYIRTPTGIAKSIALGLSIGASILAANCPPTELQKAIVDSVWKEVGLLYIALTAFSLSVVSLGICTFTADFHKNIIFKRVDLVLYFIAGLNLMIFGAGALESTLSIYVRIGDCCEQFHQVPDTTNCTLHFPGVDLGYDFFNQEVSIRQDMASKGYRFGFDLDFPACNNDTIINPWRCNMCLNQIIQPKFLWKGTSAAMGIITSIFFLIVVFVAVREARQKKVNCKVPN